MEIRKVTTIREHIFAGNDYGAVRELTRIAGIAIIRNPFSGRAAEDLSPLFRAGYDLGVRLMKEILPQLPGPAVSYGKAAMAGINGEPEHGHALLHPMLGEAMREPIGGGKALIPSVAKVAVAGTTLDVPIGHRDDAWSFDHFDAMTVSVADGPGPDELMMVVVLADGGRPAPRVGKARIAV